jgi:hypothetical protein
MKSKDVATKAVSCAANIVLQYEDGTARHDIYFEVEKTIDEQLYVSVADF